jgi:mannose-6-phosphate isomerase-like protein (cupin superfamily)
MPSKISIPTILSQITQVYSPRLVATVNNEYDIKIAKIKGPFIWHSHPDTDELFYVLSGELILQIEEEKGAEDVVLGKGELYVVKQGVRHRPMGEAEIMMIEKVGTVNRGDEEKSELTKEVVDVRSG